MKFENYLFCVPFDKLSFCHAAVFALGFGDFFFLARRRVNLGLNEFLLTEVYEHINW